MASELVKDINQEGYREAPPRIVRRKSLLTKIRWPLLIAFLGTLLLSYLSISDFLTPLEILTTIDIAIVIYV